MFTGAETLARGFASTLRERTEAVHRRAETSAFMRALFAGRLGRDAYVAYLAQLLPVYEVLDAATERLAGDPVAGPFADRRLLRSAAIERDLQALTGPGDALPPALPATAEYRARLDAVVFDWPGGFVAHHYTRHLGDLSGGRHIARAVRRHITDGPAGLAFFDLPVPDPEHYKAAYRAQLDQAPWDDAERDRIVDEVLEAYRLNEALLHEVAAAYGVAG